MGQRADISGCSTISTQLMVIHGHTGTEEIIMSLLLRFLAQVVIQLILPYISSFIPPSPGRSPSTIMMITISVDAVANAAIRIVVMGIVVGNIAVGTGTVAIVNGIIAVVTTVAVGIAVATIVVIIVVVDGTMTMGHSCSQEKLLPAMPMKST